MGETKGDGDLSEAEAVAARLERLEAILELAPVGIGLVDFEGRTTMTNSALRRMLGYSPEEFAAMSWTEFTHPDDIEPNAVLSRQLSAGDIDHFTMEKRFLRKDGGYLWTALTVSLMRDADGNPDYEIGMTLDITKRKRLESDLRAAEERSRLLVERVPAVVYVAEPGTRGRWLYVGPQIERMLGFTAQEWMADPGLWLRQLHPSDRDEALADKQHMIIAGTMAEPHSDTYRLHRRDGTPVWVRDDAMVLHDQDGTPTVQGVLVDVTQEKELEGRLAHQAFHDSLTGLPNRRLFGDRVDRALANPAWAGGGGGVTVVFIDLDNFKTVNDSFGHACGDEVIVEAARRIKACARDRDTAARLGGDEFALLLENVTIGQARALADRILATLHDTPVEFSVGTVIVGASVGIAVAEPDETTETLLRNADLAMYQAKLRGRGRYAVYESGMHQGAVAQFRLAAALQTAVAAEAITLAYQPIADLHTGVVVGLEALARWSDPELGDVPPSAFIPVAEQTGLIQELGGQVIVRACGDAARWRVATGSDAYVSVNVSPLQLDDDEFPGFVVAALRIHDLDPTSLVLEVTEGLLLQERSLETLRDIRAHGVRVAIDDFGTGYSSLSRLRELPVDMVKVDQAFVSSVESTGADPSFLQAIIRLAETMHLVTIAEGIETTTQLGELQATACAYGQGYLLARPGPIDGIPAALTAISDAPPHDR
ncbi:putative bifunctional diguanylate cyclase/phosphodiesterase [Demequina lutea]|uniref:Diguanylate cyclase (GGDEF)-like protein/PAS domain S-box-containing protein n=1 Tax=Demequina lutea TaxID=431489 RepID=A0A7Y9ZCB4_9MICO|nr:EAL domain-containing protein [Demequina lutea]NYI42744.1 diguanylate cyclase (GGDEF)-like protein/PAS domain S-box-containing protein [Demequina lutea]